MHGIAMPTRNESAAKSAMARSPQHGERDGERGYLLLGAGVMVLLLIAMLASFTFFIQRDAAYKAHFAAGARFGDLATMAHLYAQEEYFSTRSFVPREPPDCNGNRYLSSIPGNLYRDNNGNPVMPLPDEFNIPPIQGTQMEIHVNQMDLAPISIAAPCQIKAPSAYLLVRFSGREPAATSRIAFRAGAASRGMGRIGIVGRNTGPACDGQAAIVRWGPEISACLNNTHMNHLFPGVAVSTDDLIVPAWETALGRLGDQALYRFPQPERPDLNAMNHHMHFEDVSDIRQVHEFRTENLRENGASATNNDTINTMNVRYAETTHFAEPVASNNSLRIYDQDTPVIDNSTAPVMEVAGSVDFGNNSTISVGETLAVGSGTLDVVLTGNAGDTLMTRRIGTEDGITPPSTLIELTDLTGGAVMPEAAIKDIRDTSLITGMHVTSGNRLNVAGILDTSASSASDTIVPHNPLTPLNIYTAEINVPDDSGATFRSTSGVQQWNIGAINQSGSNENSGAGAVQRLVISNTLIVDDGVVDYDDCIGKACPNQVTKPPPDGGIF